MKKILNIEIDTKSGFIMIFGVLYWIVLLSSVIPVLPYFR